MRTVWSLALILLACTRQAQGDAGVSDAGVAERLEAALRRQAPGAVITHGDGTLTFTTDAGSAVLGLANLSLLCTSRPDQCEAGIVRTARSSIAEIQLKPVTREQLRACIKNPDWVKPRASIGDGVIARPWLGELSVVYMVDLPDNVNVLKRSQLKDLSIEEREIEGIALANLEAVLPQPTLTPIGGYEGIFAVYEGDDYCTSQLLFPKRFAAIAKQLGGRLIVGAPVRNALLVAGRRDAKTLSEMRKLAQETARTQAHPLTTELLEWSPEGFAMLSKAP